MKQRLFSILAGLLLAVTANTTARAAVGDVLASGTCGEGITWTLTENSDKVTSQYPGVTLTVTGTGAMSDTSYASVPLNNSSSSQSFITEVIIGEGITSFPSGAFNSYDALRRVSLPSTLTAIPNNAFTYCEALKSIVIPDGVTQIGSSFGGCDSLRSVTIGSGVKNIGLNAFKDCAQLMTVRFKRYMPDDPNPITICQGVTTDRNGSSFYGCLDLASIVVPESAFGAYLERYYHFNMYTITSPYSTPEEVPGYSRRVWNGRIEVYPTRTDRDTLFAAGSTNEWRTWCDNISHAAPRGVEVYAVDCVENRMVKLNKITATVTLPEDERDGEGDDGVRAFIPAFVPVLIKRPGGEVTAPIVAKYVMGGDITPENGWTNIQEMHTTSNGPRYEALYRNAPLTMDMMPYGYQDIVYRPVFNNGVSWEWGFVDCYDSNKNRIWGNACSYNPHYTILIDENYFVLEGDEFKRYTDTSNCIPWRQFVLEIEPSLLGSDTDSPVPLKVRYELSLADNGDNTDAIAAAAMSGNTIDELTLADRTLYKDGDWNTLCLPFGVSDFTGTPLEGATVMELDTNGDYSGNKTSYDATTGTLYIYFKNATAIQAGRPYIVKWATPSTDILSPVFSDVTVNGNAPTPVTSQDSKVSFVGNYSPVALTAGDKNTLYLGSNNTLRNPKTAVTLGSCRAYFTVNDENAEVKNFVLSFDGEDATSIHNSQFIIHNEAGAWYSLDGRKLQGKPSQKGIYIHNGRKEAMK